MPDKPILLSIVVPVYNEELIIEELVRRVTVAAESITPDYEIIFVNDGSKDSSLQKLKLACAQQPKLHFINFSRNFGHQIAITAGMDYSKGAAIVTIDGDLQDPPELIAENGAGMAKWIQSYLCETSGKKRRDFFQTLYCKGFLQDIG